MKHKISISIDKKTYQKIQKGIDQGVFRNTSHALEYAMNQLSLRSEGR